MRFSKSRRLIKKNKQKNELKEKYVDYLFNNSSAILCFTKKQISIVIQQGEGIGLFTSSVMSAV